MISFNGKVGHVRLANLTDNQVDVIIEDKPYPTLSPGSATAYIARGDASGRVQIAGNGKLWYPMSIPPRAERARTMYVLGPGKRILTPEDPTFCSGGQSAVLQVNACRRPVRFRWRGASPTRKHEAALDKLGQSKTGKLKPGVYNLEVTVGANRTASRQVKVAAGKAYSAAAYVVNGHPRIAWTENSPNALPSTNSAYQCGPVIA